MKKLIYLLFATVLFCSCEKDEMFELPVQGGTASGDLPEVLYATVADDDSDTTKTRTFVDGNIVKWHSGESISYYAGEFGNVKYTMTEGQPDGTVSAEFVKDGDAKYAFGEGAYGTPTFPLAVYPYDETQKAAFSQGGYGILLKFAQEQTYAPNSFGKGANIMVATGSSNDDDNLHFQHACGYLVIKLYGEDTNVSNITLTALGEGVKISGEAMLRVTQKKTVAFNDFANAAHNTVTLDCSNGGEGVALGADAEHATEFWFALPPVTIKGGLEITVTDTEGYTFTKKTTKDVPITRRNIQPMAALEFIPNLEPTPNRFFYTRSGGSTVPVTFHEEVGGQPFVASYDNNGTPTNATIRNHYYAAKIGKFVIECDAPIVGIKDNAFNNVGLSSVSLPSQLKTIGNYAFYQNPITELVIPGSVTLIKDHALRGNRNLQRVTFLWGEENLEIRDEDTNIFGGWVDTHSSGPFKDAELGYIYVDRNIDYRDANGEENGLIGYTIGIFRNAKFNTTAGTTAVEIGPNMSTIPESMFTGVDIVNLVIPGNITSIGKNNFCNNYKLETIEFKPSLTGTPLTMDGANVGGWGNDTGPFYLEYKDERGDKLNTIRLNREINYILEGIDSSNEGIFSQRSALSTLELGSQVRTISDYMFAETKVLTSVTLPEGLTTIGNYAFTGCTHLTSVNVPSSVTTMGNYVFWDCDALTTATLGANVIGIGVLYDCNALQNVTIKGTVLSIGNDAFYNCKAVKNLTFEPNSYSLLLTLGYQTYGTNDQSPFYDCPLETLNWNRNISYTLANAGTVDAANEGLFSQKAKLTNVTIGNQVKTIPPYTFAESGITSITIPGSVNSIGYNSFDECENLATVNIQESENNLALGYQYYYLLDKNNSFVYGTFSDSPLVNITLKRQIDYKDHHGNAYTAKEEDEGVFVNANTSTSATVVLGENVDAIHDYMFYGVPISSLTIPAGIDAIGKYAFGNNGLLTQVTCEGSAPATLDSFPFSNVKQITISVPSAAVQAYKSKWISYYDRIVGY